MRPLNNEEQDAMHTPPKIVPILVVAVLGLGSLALLTRAWGETAGAKLTEATWAGPGGDMPKRGDRLDAGTQGPGGHSRMWRCNAPGGPGGFGPGGMHHHMGWRNPGVIAEHLNAMETEIGIRANQLDAWRDFTDALQGVLHRPTPPWQTAQGGDGKPQPFALAEGLANNAIARSKSADALLKSIDELKSKLTPEQLDKVAEIEARFRAHHPGPGPHFDGPPPDDHQPQDGGPKDGSDQGDRL
jgi:hypothetical protein